MILGLMTASSLAVAVHLARPPSASSRRSASASISPLAFGVIAGNVVGRRGSRSSGELSSV